jgi:hypothetical protein
MAGLTDDEVRILRDRVGAGEKPRVVIRVASAAVAAGTRGSVVRFGDPKDSEYVVVRLGKDEVPFAPSELDLPGRKPAAAEARRSPPRARKTSRAGTAAPPKRVPPLVVTMRFRDGGWTVEAQQGSRRLAKPEPLRPGAVSAFAEHLDDDRIREALDETVEACRAVVEQRAAALRAELQLAETALQDYDKKARRP